MAFIGVKFAHPANMPELVSQLLARYPASKIVNEDRHHNKLEAAEKLMALAKENGRDVRGFEHVLASITTAQGTIGPAKDVMVQLTPSDSMTGYIGTNNLLLSSRNVHDADAIRELAEWIRSAVDAAEFEIQV